jgi:hypothetical protein
VDVDLVTVGVDLVVTLEALVLALVDLVVMGAILGDLGRWRFGRCECTVCRSLRGTVRSGRPQQYPGTSKARK